MPADATIRALRSAIDGELGAAVGERQPGPSSDDGAAASPAEAFAAQTFAGQSVDDVNFEKMTVGELAAMIGEMQRMIVSLGAHLGARAGEGPPELTLDPVRDEALAPSDVERLAEILSAIERSRVA